MDIKRAPQSATHKKTTFSKSHSFSCLVFKKQLSMMPKFSIRMRDRRTRRRRDKRATDAESSLLTKTKITLRLGGRLSMIEWERITFLGISIAEINVDITMALLELGATLRLPNGRPVKISIRIPTKDLTETVIMLRLGGGLAMIERERMTFLGISIAEINVDITMALLELGATLRLPNGRPVKISIRIPTKDLTETVIMLRLGGGLAMIERERMTFLGISIAEINANFTMALLKLGATLRLPNGRPAEINLPPIPTKYLVTMALVEKFRRTSFRTSFRGTLWIGAGVGVAAVVGIAWWCHTSTSNVPSSTSSAVITDQPRSDWLGYTCRTLWHTAVQLATVAHYSMMALVHFN